MAPLIGSKNMKRHLSKNSKRPPVLSDVVEVSEIFDISDRNDTGTTAKHEENNNILADSGGSNGGDNENDSTSSGADESSFAEASLYEQHVMKKEKMAAQETRYVRRLRFLVFLVLAVCTAVVGWAVYHYITNSEEAEFEAQFEEDSRKLLASLGHNLDRNLESMDALTTNMVSFARYTNQTWPFVVIPDFGVRAEKIRAMSGGIYINTYPLVQDSERAAWENFTAQPTSHDWINQTIRLQEENPGNTWPIIWNYTMWDVIHGYDEWDKPNPGEEGTNRTGPYLPFWQSMPMIPYDPPYNWDLMTIPDTTFVEILIDTHKVTLSQAYLIHLPDSDPEVIEQNIAEADWVSDYLTTDEDPMEPMVDYYYPIIDHSIDQLSMVEESNYNAESNKVLGILSLSMYWRDTLKDILPDGSNGLVVVFENECNPTFTYQVDGSEVTFLGAGDLHQEKYDYLGVSSSLIELRDFAIADRKYSGRPVDDSYCPYFISIYPSDQMLSNFTTTDATVFTIGAIFIFVFTSLMFILYDCYVERRHQVIEKKAVQSKNLVDTLFPAIVRTQVEEQAMDHETPKNKLTTFLNDGSGFDVNAIGGDFHQDTSIQGKPIAELFPHTTVMFADIAGFTAWASVREPTQVFTLLETLYGKFDRSARRRGVFKVETIGDCYVAVCGLPEPRSSHALIMCKFAYDCREKMKQTTSELEITLGPGTADLSLRIGLHSGPTTAGVLRGEKARFQLFGDTVNTAARMESTGLPNFIQVSQKTADLVIEGGKPHWLQPRDETVNAKGKGKLQTFFVEPVGSARSALTATSHTDLGGSGMDLGYSEDPVINSKTPLLIDWNTAFLEGLLVEIVGHRKALSSSKRRKNANTEGAAVEWVKQEGMVRDEVTEMIQMPKFDPKSQEAQMEADLSSEAKLQLRDYVGRIADTYPGNSFHNFEHASHVMMSVSKLLQRIANRDVKKEEKLTKRSYYDYTYGITSDPITKFAVAFSALIHDADHQGVPNGQLIKEGSVLAAVYDNKSMAEQNSIDLAWDLLMEPVYKDLRAAIYSTDEELHRFRQLVVNCVMATDIFDKELKTLRENRWERVFSSPVQSSEFLVEQSLGVPIMPSSTEDDWNRKATIVIEYIIQASDVAHTMQHWHVYQKWNGKLFNECYDAYLNGRSEKDPSLGWYQGELWFFDNYIIPLAKKLKECEVFGVACDEFLDFALENRKEWAVKGKEIVAELLSKCDTNVSKPKQTSHVSEQWI